MSDTGIHSNPLREYFENNPGRMIDKWVHYFDIYHRHFARFRGTACTLVEIGVYHGGSLQMWRHYLGPLARIVGVDIAERSATLREPGIEIIIGDQADRNFLAQLRQHAGNIDILIDDGGHTMRQQQATLEELYPAISPNGVYLCEDLHTSYWTEFGGGFRAPSSFIELAKRLIDQVNAWHSRDLHSFHPTGFTSMTDGMHFYDSVLVLDKAPREPPVRRQTGRRSFPLDASQPTGEST